jgi:hypothetical protein
MDREEAREREQQQIRERRTCPGAYPRRHRHRGDLLNGFDKSRRRGGCAAEWTDKALDESRRLRVATAVSGKCRGQLRHMLVETPRHAQHTGVFVEEILQVQRAFLVVLRNLRLEDSEHGLPDDGRFDEGTGVDPDHRGAVVERVEVVLLRLGIDRVSTPERNVGIAGEIDLLPFIQSRRVWSNQDPDVFQPRVGTAAHRLDPALGERRLERRAPEQ